MTNKQRQSAYDKYVAFCLLLRIKPAKLEEYEYTINRIYSMPVSVA